jgi:hypothetical protein
MSSDMIGLAIARQRWPKHPNGLPPPVHAVFTAWEQCREADQDEALDQIDGFTRPDMSRPHSAAISTALVCHGRSPSVG